MNQNNNVFAADSDSLALDIACYRAMFEKYLPEFIEANGHTDPEITWPILEAYNVGGGPAICRLWLRRLLLA